MALPFKVLFPCKRNGYTRQPASGLGESATRCDTDKQRLQSKLVTDGNTLAVKCVFHVILQSCFAFRFITVSSSHRGGVDLPAKPAYV
jgi:hypothetical protein